MNLRSKKTASLVLLFGIVCLLVSSPAIGAEWTDFRGPNRDGKSTETGLLKSWPPGGPKLLWTSNGCGTGYASVTIANGLIYTTGSFGKETAVVAFDMNGERKWSTSFCGTFKGRGPGSRGTPTIDGGKLYAEGPQGMVVCLDAATGDKVWSVNLMQKFGGRNIRWALSESLLVDGDNVICCPGGASAAMVALNKSTGETVWVCKGEGDKPGYASPVLIEYEGLRQILAMMSHSIIGVNADTGALLWRYEHVTKYDVNATNPIFHNGHIFIASGYGKGCALVKLNVSGKEASATEVWRSKELDNHHGGVILLDGYLYGSAFKKNWICMDFMTGDVKYRDRRVQKGSVVYAEGMLYCLSERGGRVLLVKASPESCDVVSRFSIPGAGGHSDVWAHPVVCGGRLYIRNKDSLFAYDVKGQ